jgi:hypothetical protein
MHTKSSSGSLEVREPFRKLEVALRALRKYVITASAGVNGGSCERNNEPWASTQEGRFLNS